MSLLLIDGMEDVSSWVAAGTPTIVAGRNGNCVSVAGSSATLSFNIPTPDQTDTLTVGAAVKFAVVPGATQSIFEFRSDAGVTAHVLLQGSATVGALAVLRSPSTALLTSGVLLTVGAWYYIEYQAKLHDTTGTATVRVNGVVVASGTSLDTRNAGTKTVFDQVRLTGFGGGTTTYDDLYISNDTTFLGDMSVETLYPNGNGNANQWLGSDADSVNNYLLVDEAGAPVTTDYTGSPTTGQQDLYAMSNLVRTGGQVLGVCHQAFAASSDAGAKQFKIVNRRAADTKSAAQTLTTTYTPYHYCLSTDPETGAAWTIANVNNLQSGVEVV